MHKREIESCGSDNGPIRQAGQIEYQVNDNIAAIDQLANVLNRLEDRLHQSLRPPSPQCGTDTCKDEELVPLADVLRMNCRRVDSLRDQVESILSRLEL